MITDGFSRDKAIIGPEDIYRPSQTRFRVCICTFSPKILEELLSLYSHTVAAYIGSVKGAIPVYAVRIDGRTFGAFSIGVGAPVASADLIDVNCLTGANTFVVFGSAGIINNKAVDGRYVVPTAAYRDEGTSYHYAPPSDYIPILGNRLTAKVFSDLGIPCVFGRTWTTDAFYRETEAKLKKRAEEGCLTVEMEMAALQAVCSFHGFTLLSFLHGGDVLDGEKYDHSGLHGANHDLNKLSIAIEIAKRA